jgi:hypothetical protein
MMVEFGDDEELGDFAGKAPQKEASKVAVTQWAIAHNHRMKKNRSLHSQVGK